MNTIAFKKISQVMSVALLAAFASFAGSASAELVATPLQGDSRLVQFPFDEDNTYLVLAKPKAVTHLQFAGDETIQSVAAGDTQSWEFTPTKNRRHIFVKPKFENLETSVSVLTNKRIYQLVLKSTGDGRKWYQRVNWLYGTELVLEEDFTASAVDAGIVPAQSGVAQSKTATPSDLPAGLKADQLRFGYEIAGDAPFKPTVVFDDGKFTYIGMPPKLQELPALFAVIDGTDYALVNYTVTDNYMVAQRLLDSAVLKLGKQEVKVTRPEPKSSFFNWSAK